MTLRTAPPAPSVAAREPSSLQQVSVQRERLVAVAALGSVLSLAALTYWWTRAPLYNPAGMLDPWFYTALFVNYDELVHHFGTTYYASRLPWVVPGRITYGLLPVEAAYWVLHGLAFAGGVAALFVLVRRYLGLASACVGAGTLSLSVVYWNAQYWDYIDGVTLTYLLAGLCFGLPLATGRLRTASLSLAGAAFAAAVTTNLFVALVALIYPILYLFVQPATGLRRRAAQALADAIPLVLGAAALVVALGLHSITNGAGFLYFEPQIEVIRNGTGQWKAPDYEWLWKEPKVLVPVFLLVVAAPLLALARRLPQFGFAAGSYAGLAFLTAAIYGWEFLAGGNVLELSYYFSYFSVPIALTLASVAALAGSVASLTRREKAAAAFTAIMAAAAALAAIYREDRLDWVGRTGMNASVAVIALAGLAVLALVLLRRTRLAAPAAVAATGAVALACQLALNSSYATFVFGSTHPENRSLYAAALEHVDFVKESTALDGSLPMFWYQEETRPDIRSVQSMYLYGYTYLDLDLPNVTSVVRERIDTSKPVTIMMLCGTRDCGGGAAALRRAGYPYAEARARRISHGPIRFWAVLLRKVPGV